MGDQILNSTDNSLKDIETYVMIVEDVTLITFQNYLYFLPLKTKITDRKPTDRLWEEVLYFQKLLKCCATCIVDCILKVRLRLKIKMRENAYPQ